VNDKAGLPGTLARGLWHGLRAAASMLLALLILFEEWGWEPLQRALAWLGRLPVWRRVEAAIARLPPYGALAVIALPGLLLLPLKLVAVALVVQGHARAGLLVIVLAKLVGTALLARLFTLTRPALLRLDWFAELYTRWVAWKSALLARVRASWLWRAARALRRSARQRWARWRHGPPR
jgi:hypothetical protein